MKCWWKRIGMTFRSFCHDKAERENGADEKCGALLSRSEIPQSIEGRYSLQKVSIIPSPEWHDP
jgi:hypothetical protein